MDKKKIIIFGATGNVGSYLTLYALNFFNKDEYEVIASGRRKTDFWTKQGVPYYSVDLTKAEDFDVLPKAVRTNIMGTQNVLDSAAEHDVKRVVVLSTDKAAYPINAMGMSKALMEKTAVAKARALGDKEPVICCTRYGNVMASRGSVIPLWIDQIKNGKPITITDPNMTRFMMTLDDAVDLVLYAFENGVNGDLFVQKAPAATLMVLAKALKELYRSDNEIKTIGTRHGEKLYETLVTREEMFRAQDRGNYYRIPIDDRDLNYDKYFVEGVEDMTKVEEYHSHNTHRLDVEEMKQLLMKLPEVRGDVDLFIR